jgi:hypothetical protein
LVIPLTVNATMIRGSNAGQGPARAIGAATSSPTTITQATAVVDPRMRLDRDEQSVEVAHRHAVAKPPRRAIIGRSPGARQISPR